MATPIDLRFGDWRDVLADVAEVDAVICDPPYGGRVHEGDAAAAVQQVGVTGQPVRHVMRYARYSPADVEEFVAFWSSRCRGWMVAFTSHDLIPAWERAYVEAGRYAFAPVVHVRKRPRLLGDGPASWVDYVMVSRPRTREWSTWRCLPGAYFESGDRSPTTGGKSLGVMRAIVRDYSRSGDLVVDPCSGGATTLLAAVIEGRRAVGAELDSETYEAARSRIARGYTPAMDFCGEGVGLGRLPGLGDSFVK